MTMPPRERMCGYRCGQGRFSITVEIGVGFVEDNQERIAVKRPRQRNPLLWPADKFAPISPMMVRILQVG